MQKRIDLQKFNRILDANFNRAKEGLRVCEDICRFVWDVSGETKKWKRIRHELTTVVSVLGLRDILKARDIEHDVGRRTHAAEMKRRHVDDIFYANCQRVKESMRVLEEFAKLSTPSVAQKLKILRYQIYALEKNGVKKS